MNRHILMSFLKSVVLSYVMKVVSSDDDCPLHLHLDDHTSKDSSSNHDVSGERALLVNVMTFSGLPWSSESQPNFPDITNCLLASLQQLRLLVEEDVMLLLEGSLGLSIRHD